MRIAVVAINLLLVEFCATGAFAQRSDPSVQFEQRLGNRVDPRLEFKDETGQTVQLGNYLHQNRPVMVELGYYDCPMLCGVILNALTESLQDFPPASKTRDFNFLFVSINPTETTTLAADKRKNYLRRLGWNGAAERWHFVTGSEQAIQALAEVIGFHYRYDKPSGQYIHPSGLVVLSADGEVRHYLLGIEFPAKDLQTAIEEGRNERPPTLVENLLLICFAHDPKPGSSTYFVLWILRAGALLTVGGVVVIVWRFRGRKAVT